jgi:hypothetical protein
MLLLRGDLSKRTLGTNSTVLKRVRRITNNYLRLCSTVSQMDAIEVRSNGKGAVRES